jgi:hypothetical protein
MLETPTAASAREGDNGSERSESTGTATGAALRALRRYPGMQRG